MLLFLLAAHSIICKLGFSHKCRLQTWQSRCSLCDPRLICTFCPAVPAATYLGSIDACLRRYCSVRYAKPFLKNKDTENSCLTTNCRWVSLQNYILFDCSPRTTLCCLLKESILSVSPSAEAGSRLCYRARYCPHSPRGGLRIHKKWSNICIVCLFVMLLLALWVCSVVVRLSVSLFLCQSACLPVCLFVCLSACLRASFSDSIFVSASRINGSA